MSSRTMSSQPAHISSAEHSTDLPGWGHCTPKYSGNMLNFRTYDSSDQLYTSRLRAMETRRQNALGEGFSLAMEQALHIVSRSQDRKRSS